MAKLSPLHRAAVVGGSLKTLLRVSVWEFGAWMDSDTDAQRVGMGSSVMSGQWCTYSFQPRKYLNIWLLVSDGVMQGHPKSTLSAFCVIEASPGATGGSEAGGCLALLTVEFLGRGAGEALALRAPTLSFSLHIPGGPRNR